MICGVAVPVFPVERNATFKIDGPAPLKQQAKGSTNIPLRALASLSDCSKGNGEPLRLLMPALWQVPVFPVERNATFKIDGPAPVKQQAKGSTNIPLHALASLSDCSKGNGQAIDANCRVDGDFQKTPIANEKANCADSMRTTAAFPDFAGLSARELGFGTHEQVPIAVPVADGEAVKVMDSEIEARYEMIFTKSMVVSERNLAATTERNCQEPCLSGVRRTTAAFPDFAGLSARELGFGTHEQVPIAVPVADGEAVKVMDSEIEARYEMIFTKSMVVSERNLAATTERNCQEPCLSGEVPAEAPAKTVPEEDRVKILKTATLKNTNALFRRESDSALTVHTSAKKESGMFGMPPSRALQLASADDDVIGESKKVPKKCKQHVVRELRLNKRVQKMRKKLQDQKKVVSPLSQIEPRAVDDDSTHKPSSVPKASSSIASFAAADVVSVPRSKLIFTLVDGQYSFSITSSGKLSLQIISFYKILPNEPSLLEAASCGAQQSSTVSRDRRCSRRLSPNSNGCKKDEDCEEDYTDGDKRKPKKKRTLKEVDDGKGERVSKHRKRCCGKLNGRGCRRSTNALSLVVPFGMLL
ncbi:hypothetical protein Tcan_06658 [Toxocara canis]|uniref:Uncharacterized protein n=1 Tax=Toxocara canis TaxID=6265 RepID=A0A0B2V6W8_TOXCA|nr:hypothetical protein Tcan_06658 [Toxocara canis]